MKTTINGYLIEGSVDEIKQLLFSQNNNINVVKSKRGRPKLNTGVRSKILNFFYSHKNEYFNCRAVGATISLQDNTVSPAISHLYKVGLLIRRENNGRYEYCINLNTYPTSTYYPKGLV